ncbi:MAG: hypothetical protein J7K66_06485 [Anaerolineaceae bacterium]|nr:hypothetical protein [Anaerolineaceae bacterium]
MVGKLSDLFKKKDEKEEAKKKVQPKPVSKVSPKGVKRTAKRNSADFEAKLAAVKKNKAAAKKKKEEEFMHSRTHQDLINAGYKAAEALKIDPWVLLPAAKWNNFTDDREKIYDGPMIDDIDTLDDAQKAALKKALGLDK